MSKQCETCLGWRVEESELTRVNSIKICECNIDNEIPYNPWQPMSNPKDLKYIGKLSEETGELNAAIGRCLVQGIDECEPVTGKVNKEWLEDEMADVLANINLNIKHFGLNVTSIFIRRDDKMRKLKVWHEEL